MTNEVNVVTDEELITEVVRRLKEINPYTAHAFQAVGIILKVYGERQPPALVLDRVKLQFLLGRPVSENDLRG